MEMINDGEFNYGEIDGRLNGNCDLKISCFLLKIHADQYIKIYSYSKNYLSIEYCLKIFKHM